MKKLFTLALLAATALQLSAQAIQFKQQNNLFSDTYNSGVGMMVVDADGDRKDDIVHFDMGRNIFVDLQQHSLSEYLLWVGPNMSTSSAWTVCAGDLDNNGFNEFMSAGSYDNVKVAMNDGAALTKITLPTTSLFAQGSNFADINNDGWLDVFVCHDDGESRIWGNNGDGTMTLHDEWIDMATTPASDNSGNYGSQWTDFDNDGDLDLYIAKCRQGVTDPTDPRRINALFVNDGNNNYTEMAAAHNLNSGWQSWTADFGDFNNDGWLDCFITNHDHNCELMLNDGAGNFTDVYDQSGLNVTVLPIQGIFRDFDNDGWLDIIVTGSDEQLFHNNGDNTFTEITGAFDGNDMESLAVGDVNHDGFLDIVGGYANIYTSPTSVSDKLWMGVPNDNHFLAFDLQGTVSNRSAVGARVVLELDNGMKLIREVHAGDSYGIMNSMTLYFGLGQHEVTSATITWPAGGTQVIENPIRDQFIHVIENDCVSTRADITVSGGDAVLCPGESITLTANAPINNTTSYLWSTGEYTQSIVVSATGRYGLTVTNGTNCEGSSPNVDVVNNPDNNVTLQIDVEGMSTICSSDEVTLTAPDGYDSYTWSNGETTQSIAVNATDVYTVLVPGFCGNIVSPGISINAITPDAPVGTGATILPNETATLTAIGNNITWYSDAAATTTVAQGGSFTTPVLTETTSYYITSSETLSSEPVFTGQEALSATNSAYSSNSFQGRMMFTVYQPLTIQEVTVETDMAGVRRIQVTDPTGTEIAGVDVDLAVGVTTVPLNFDLPNGLYRMTTLQATNQASLGFNGPRLARSDSNISYPYTVPNVISIDSSNATSDVRYYYFYNWKVKPADMTCTSDVVEVLATVSTSSTTDAASSPIALSPNPARTQVTIDMPRAVSGQLAIVDALGRTLRTQMLENALQATIQVADLPAGSYTVRFVTGTTTWTKPLVIAR